MAAVNIATHVGRRTLDELRAELLPALRGAAARIETDLSTAGHFARIALH